MEIQRLLGSDIQMQLDECLALSAHRGEMRAGDAAVAALGGALAAPPSATQPGKALFGIVQGGDRSERCAAESAERLAAIGFDGYAIGGLAVGEAPGADAGDASMSPRRAARRQAALSDGRRHAGRHRRGGGARHRHVRLRACRPAPAATARPSPASARSICGTPGMPTIRARSIPRQRLPGRFATIRGPICIIWSSRARSSA